MVKPKLLIIGDSFSANTSPDSWATQLDYDITNISSRGSSEYRILKKLEAAEIEKYQKILIVHTSPNRIYVEHNPLHKDREEYHTCDLIYADVKCKPESQYTQSVVWWFENCWDQENANYMHSLLINRAQKLTDGRGVHITFFNYDHPGVESLQSIWAKYPGQINHLSVEGNQAVLNILKKYL